MPISYCRCRLGYPLGPSTFRSRIGRHRWRWFADLNSCRYRVRRRNDDDSVPADVPQAVCASGKPDALHWRGRIRAIPTGRWRCEKWLISLRSSTARTSRSITRRNCCAARFRTDRHGRGSAESGIVAWVFTGSAGDIMGAPCTEYVPSAEPHEPGRA
jgi:hypothetical protein